MVESISGMYCSKNGFNRCPFTLKISPFLGFSISMVPWGKTVFTMNGPVHLDCNFPGNRWSLKLYSKTFWEGSNVFLKMFLSWKTFIFFLEIWAFSYASIDLYDFDDAKILSKLILCLTYMWSDFRIKLILKACTYLLAP